MSHNILF